jgi:glycosyltransferase involved in cell wall biosynthesis
MKILLGVPEYPPYHVGGGGEVFKNLAENYKKLGHEVVVMYGYYPTKTRSEDIKEYINKNGIKFYRIPEILYPKTKPFLRTVMPPNLQALFKLRKIIEQERPDIAHLHGYGFILIYLISRVLNKCRINYVFTIHGYPEIQKKSSLAVHLAWRVFERQLVRPVLRRAFRVTCISNYIKNDSRNIRKADSVVIYNGINTNDFKETRTDIDVRIKHRIPANGLCIFSLGRIAEMKGFQVVINLLPALKKNGQVVKYLIAGQDDGYKAQLEQLVHTLNITECVEFVGCLSLEEKKQYIKQCDVFAIPSLWEPFGLVALEGMIFKKPILSGGNGALGEVMDGYLGWIDLSQIRSLRQGHLPDSIQYDCGKWDWKNIVPQYISVLIPI